MLFASEISLMEWNTPHDDAAAAADGAFFSLSRGFLLPVYHKISHENNDAVDNAQNCRRSHCVKTTATNELA